MKKIFALIVAMLLIAGTAYAGSIYSGSITATTTAQSLTTSTEGIRSALITVIGGAVNVGFYSAPTLTAGHELSAGSHMTLDDLNDISKFQVILTNGNSTSTTTTVYYTLFDKE